jgi:uncharacterized protein (UPF0335 family)
MSNFSFSQDTISIPQSELNQFIEAVEDLEHQDSLKTILIQDLEYQIKNYEFLSKQDSTILSYKQQEIKLLNEQIKIYDDRLKKVDKWYKKPWIGFVAGTLTTVLTIHVINYTLP